MRERPGTLQRVILSPGVSALVALGGAALMLAKGAEWYEAAAMIVLAGVMIHVMRSESLFRGEYIPLAGVTMMAQAVLPIGLEGLAMGATAVLTFAVASRCYGRPDFTRTIFLLFLLSGCGALWFNGFAFFAAVAVVMLILLRMISLRGLDAALLGLITPAILYLPFNPDLPAQLIERYSTPLNPSYTNGLATVGIISILAALATFLTAYGYPAKNRARNMALLALSLGTLGLAVADSKNMAAYCPAVSLCCGYNVAHFASLGRFNAFAVVIIWIILGVATHCI